MKPTRKMIERRISRAREDLGRAPHDYPRQGDEEVIVALADERDAAFFDNAEIKANRFNVLTKVQVDLFNTQAERDDLMVLNRVELENKRRVTDERDDWKRVAEEAQRDKPVWDRLAVIAEELLARRG